VGSSGPSPTEAHAVIERYNGSGWAMENSPAAPAGHGYALLGVSCVSTVDCWAVGTDSVTGGSAPLVEHYDGRGWSVIGVPAGAAVAGLRAVACATPTDCWTVGWMGTSPTSPLVEHLDDTAWMVSQPPSVPGSGDATLNAVTCLPDGECWTVGAVDVDHPLMARLHGVAWITVPTAVIGGGEPVTLTGVSCTRAPRCWAVGSVREAGILLPLVEVNDGSGWRVATISRPFLSRGGVLTSVTCARAQECWAAGEVSSLAGSQLPLTEAYNGFAWTVVPAPAHAPTAIATSIACSDEDDCWTVGRCTPPASSGCRGSASLIEMYDSILPDGH
jgi:hypothetical protein